MDALDAAKAYLRKQRDARPFPEILEAVRGGSAKVEAENKLRTQVSRSTLDVVKINDRYGWLDNYPHEKSKRLKGIRRGPVADDPKDDSEGNGQAVDE